MSCQTCHRDVPHLSRCYRDDTFVCADCYDRSQREAAVTHITQTLDYWTRWQMNHPHLVAETVRSWLQQHGGTR